MANKGLVEQARITMMLTMDKGVMTNPVNRRVLLCTKNGFVLVDNILILGCVVFERLCKCDQQVK